MCLSIKQERNKKIKKMENGIHFYKQLQVMKTVELRIYKCRKTCLSFY